MHPTHRLPASLFLSLVVAVIVAAPAGADPIRITGGQIVVKPGLNGTGTVGLIGTGDFSLTGQLSGAGSVGARNTCFPCEPGATISLGATWSGLDLLSTVAAFQGTVYPQVGGANSTNQLIMRLAGSTVAPPFTPGSPATVSAPFTLEGLFFFSQPTGPVNSETLVGSGIATLTLLPLPGGPDVPPDLWQYGGVRFDFSNGQQAPIPEPGSLLLVGTGLALVGGRVLRKMRKR